MTAKLKTPLRYLLAFAMTAVGILHFVTPEPFLKIVPPQLPAAMALVLLSGAFEVLLGLALLPQRTRKWAGWGLIALYLAVFPANLHMAINNISFDEAEPISPVVLWGRLPFQLLFIIWAYWVSRPDTPSDDDSAAV